VRVIDGGEGYVDPIAVIVAPGDPNENAVPVWAAAGALKSSTRDMISFAQAALGHSVVNGVRIDPRLRRAFQLAQRGYACEIPGQRPCLLLSGLAWTRNPANGGVPAPGSKKRGGPRFHHAFGLVAAPEPRGLRLRQHRSDRRDVDERQPATRRPTRRRQHHVRDRASDQKGEAR